MRPVIFLFFLFLSLLAEQKTLACTAFCLNNGNQIVVAKNFDWSVDLGYIFVNKLSLTEISYQVGYSSVQHLSNQFKKNTGFSPSQFKKLKEKKRNPFDKV